MPVVSPVYVLDVFRALLNCNKREQLMLHTNECVECTFVLARIHCVILKMIS